MCLCETPVFRLFVVVAETYKLDSVTFFTNKLVCLFSLPCISNEHTFTSICRLHLWLHKHFILFTFVLLFFTVVLLDAGKIIFVTPNLEEFMCKNKYFNVSLLTPLNFVFTFGTVHYPLTHRAINSTLGSYLRQYEYLFSLLSCESTEMKFQHTSTASA